MTKKCLRNNQPSPLASIELCHVRACAARPLAPTQGVLSLFIKRLSYYRHIYRALFIVFLYVWPRLLGLRSV